MIDRENISKLALNEIIEFAYADKNFTILRLNLPMNSLQFLNEKLSTLGINPTGHNQYTIYGAQVCLNRVPSKQCLGKDNYLKR